MRKQAVYVTNVVFVVMLVMMVLVAVIVHVVAMVWWFYLEEAAALQFEVDALRVVLMDAHAHELHKLHAAAPSLS